MYFGSVSIHTSRTHLAFDSETNADCKFFCEDVFHYIDYQAYVFQAMMVNQFKKTTYECAKTGDDYYCMYPSDLGAQGKIRGTAVLDAYHYSYEDGKAWEWFGIMLAIILVYRILGYLVLLVKTRKS